jgi:hypothetical protein
VAEEGRIVCYPLRVDRVSRDAFTGRHADPVPMRHCLKNRDWKEYPSGRKREACIARALFFQSLTPRPVRRGVLAWAFSWGHKNAGGTSRSDRGDRAEKGEPRIPGGVPAWCDARDRFHTAGSFFLRCTQTGQGCASLATNDSPGRIRVQSPGSLLLPKKQVPVSNGCKDLHCLMPQFAKISIYRMSPRQKR